MKENWHIKLNLFSIVNKWNRVIPPCESTHSILIINYEKKIIPEKASIYITTQLCFPLGEKYIFSDMNLEVNPFLQRNLEASVDIPYKIMN